MAITTFLRIIFQKTKKLGGPVTRSPCFMSIRTIGLGYPRKPRRTPAATAEPITPATLGPMACMSR